MDPQQNHFLYHLPMFLLFAKYNYHISERTQGWSKWYTVRCGISQGSSRSQPTIISDCVESRYTALLTSVPSFGDSTTQIGQRWFPPCFALPEYYCFSAPVPQLEEEEGSDSCWEAGIKITISARNQEQLFMLSAFFSSFSMLFQNKLPKYQITQSWFSQILV